MWDRKLSIPFMAGLWGSAGSEELEEEAVRTVGEKQHWDYKMHQQLWDSLQETTTFCNMQILWEVLSVKWSEYLTHVRSWPKLYFLSVIYVTSQHPKWCSHTWQSILMGTQQHLRAWKDSACFFFFFSWRHQSKNESNLFSLYLSFKFIFKL